MINLIYELRVLYIIINTASLLFECCNQISHLEMYNFKMYKNILRYDKEYEANVLNI